MSALPPNPSPRVRHPVSPSKSAQTLQMVQGAYYVVFGVLTAAFVQMWGSVVNPQINLNHDWAIRLGGAVVAVFGAYLWYCGWKGGRAPAGAGWWVALILMVIESGGLALGLLPMPLLIDLALEALWFASWIAIMARQVEKQASGTGGTNPVNPVVG